MKNVVIKYAFILFGLLILGVLMHYGFIAPFINTLCSGDICGGIMQGLTLMIAEPVICIMIVVYLINRQEKKYYDSLV